MMETAEPPPSLRLVVVATLIIASAEWREHDTVSPPLRIGAVGVKGQKDHFQPLDLPATGRFTLKE
jgi:hypothetical protein